ncbi:putative deacetylase LmbE-like domain-containing protein [Xylariaceae sp. FL1651]|nr:putative deacetylase LmbE-like domain-containing protein [Xylariaceae sp. FL1651]
MDGTQQDSPLSITANIAGILTFVVAILAAIYVRITYLRNSDQEYFQVKTSLSWFKTESKWLTELVKATGDRQDATHHPEHHIYTFVMDDLLKLEKRLLELVEEVEEKAGSQAEHPQGKRWAVVPQNWRSSTAVAVAWLPIRAQTLELVRQREALTARVSFTQMSTISSRIRNLEWQSKLSQETAKNNVDKLEAIIQDQKAEIHRLEDLVSRTMYRNHTSRYGTDSPRSRDNCPNHADSSTTSHIHRITALVEETNSSSQREDSPGQIELNDRPNPQTAQCRGIRYVDEVAPGDNARSVGMEHVEDRKENYTKLGLMRHHVLPTRATNARVVICGHEISMAYWFCTRTSSVKCSMARLTVQSKVSMIFSAVGDSPSSSSPSPPALVLLWRFFPIILLVILPLLYTYTSSTTQARFPTLRNKRICLLIAHPDDEAMFFAPTVLALTRPESGNHVKILCLSTGNADGLGETRRRELIKSAMLLGLRQEDDVFVIDSPDFPDSMTTIWDSNRISALLCSAFAPHLSHSSKSSPSDDAPTAAIDVLVTFDGSGVSSHPNHISLYHGARVFISTLLKGKPGWASPVDLYTLTSVGVLRKYVSFFDTFTTMIVLLFRGAEVRRQSGKGNPGTLMNMSGLLGGRESYGSARRAMTDAHKSQMVWFRWGWILLSRYMVINDLKLERIKS